MLLLEHALQLQVLVLVLVHGAGPSAGDGGGASAAATAAVAQNLNTVFNYFLKKLRCFLRFLENRRKAGRGKRGKSRQVAASPTTMKTTKTRTLHQFS